MCDREILYVNRAVVANAEIDKLLLLHDDADIGTLKLFDKFVDPVG